MFVERTQGLHFHLTWSWLLTREQLISSSTPPFFHGLLLVGRGTSIFIFSSAMAAFSTVPGVVVDTGNLLASDDFKRKALLLPSAEVMEGLSLTLSRWCEGKEENELQINEEIVAIRNAKLDKKIDPESRDRVKISVKFFAYTESCTLFTSALSYFMSALNVTFIDTLTISPPPTRAKGSIEEMKPMWSCAVSNVMQGKIKELGVSDLDTEQLKELYEWAEETKPSTNQINLDACCVIPPEMNEFASLKEIRLLTHNDPRDILPSDKLCKTLSDLNIPNAKQWKCLWLLRYSANQIANGVIDGKGYMLFLTKVENVSNN